MTAPSPHLSDAQAQQLVDGALPQGEAAHAERHLAGCTGCRATVETYRMLAASLDDLEVPALPADFTDVVLARVDERARALARERRQAVAILASVAVAAAAAFGVAGASAWAPVLSSAADVLAATLHAARIGSDFVPKIVSALRPQIILATAVLALPLLLALSRLMPAPRAETA